MSCQWKRKQDCRFCAVEGCDSRKDEFNLKETVAAVAIKPYEGPDEIDEWLFKKVLVRPGVCSSIELIKYRVAKAVAEKLWPKEGVTFVSAEKDLALTIDDIERLHALLYAVKHNKQGAFTFHRLSDEQYQEVLNRFNNAKK